MPKFMRMKHLLKWSLLAVLALATTADLAAQLETPKNGPFNVALYQGAQWRSIGPYRGGRSVTVAGVHEKQNTPDTFCSSQFFLRPSPPPQ